MKTRSQRIKNLERKLNTERRKTRGKLLVLLIGFLMESRTNPGREAEMKEIPTTVEIANTDTSPPSTTGRKTNPGGTKTTPKERRIFLGSRQLTENTIVTYVIFETINDICGPVCKT